MLIGCENQVVTPVANRALFLLPGYSRALVVDCNVDAALAVETINGERVILSK